VLHKAIFILHKVADGMHKAAGAICMRLAGLATGEIVGPELAEFGIAA